MKKLSAVTVIALVITSWGYSTCTVDGYMGNLPIEDENGTHWTIYDLADPENRVIVESDPSCMTQIISGFLLWTAELGYWLPPPAVGDSCLIIGSWDSSYVNDPSGYGNNSNHTGFYWLYSDTIDDVSSTHWEQDTLRPMPAPRDSIDGPGGIGNDTIWIKIPNPRETRYSGQTAYDVLGFWIFADSTASGTPDAFNSATVIDLGFIPVNGVFGDTTEFRTEESNKFDPFIHWTTYFAYKIVARPDTTADNVGYSTYYFSQNSGAIDVYHNIVGTEENKNVEQYNLSIYSYPNPYSKNTRIVFTIPRTTSVKLNVYNTSGQLINTLLDETKPAGEYTIEYKHVDLPSGVYFYQLQTSEQQLTGRLTKLR
jgi:hypothetical protein